MGSTGGWNRSTANQPTVKKDGAKAPSALKGIVAGLVVVCVLGGLCLWMFSGSEEAPKSKPDKERGRIKAVTPAKAPTNVVKVVEAKPKKHSKYVDYDPDKVFKDDRGVLRYKHGNGRVPLSDEEMQKYLVHQNKYERRVPSFRHECENEIAVLIALEPGEMIFGDFDHGKSWQKDFVEALTDPIEINEEDSEFDKQIKKQVEEVKHDLAKRLKQGEDIAKLLEDTRDDLRRLANFKDQIRELVDEQVENAQSAEDVETCFAAMNKMLEDKGLAPVKMNKMMRSVIERSYMKKQAGDGETNNEGVNE